MDDHEGTQDERKLNTVHDIKTEQGLMAYFVRSQKKKTNIVSNEGSIGHDRRPYGNAPVSKLIPREKISCVTECQGKNEEADSNHPIKLPRRPVGTRVEYPHHMKEDGHHHSMSGPSMQIS